MAQGIDLLAELFYLDGNHQSVYFGFGDKVRFSAFLRNMLSNSAYYETRLRSSFTHWRNLDRDTLAVVMDSLTYIHRKNFKRARSATDFVQLMKEAVAVNTGDDIMWATELEVHDVKRFLKLFGIDLCASIGDIKIYLSKKRVHVPTIFVRSEGNAHYWALAPRRVMQSVVPLTRVRVKSKERLEYFPDQIESDRLFAEALAKAPPSPKRRKSRESSSPWTRRVNSWVVGLFSKKGKNQPKTQRRSNTDSDEEIARLLQQDVSR